MSLQAVNRYVDEETKSSTWLRVRISRNAAVSKRALEDLSGEWGWW